MGLLNWARPSESSWISSVWTSRSADVTEMTAVASETWGLVFWRASGVTSAAVTGPESGTSSAPVPEDALFIGTQFAVGVSLRAAKMEQLVDSGVLLPDTTERRFWLGGSRWEIPNPDDVEMLAARLAHDGVIERDPVVTASLQGRRPASTERTVERRFRAATGLTRGTVDQIARVRNAADHLTAGKPVGEVVVDCGFYDESHLARALRRYVGRTAAELRRGDSGVIALFNSADNVVDGLRDSVGVRRGLAESQ